MSAKTCTANDAGVGNWFAMIERVLQEGKENKKMETSTLYICCGIVPEDIRQGIKEQLAGIIYHQFVVFSLGLTSVIP